MYTKWTQISLLKNFTQKFDCENKLIGIPKVPTKIFDGWDITHNFFGS